jgi:hypothetical protein
MAAEVRLCRSCGKHRDIPAARRAPGVENALTASGHRRRTPVMERRKYGSHPSGRVSSQSSLAAAIGKSCRLAPRGPVSALPFADAHEVVVRELGQGAGNPQIEFLVGCAGRPQTAKVAPTACTVVLTIVLPPDAGHELQVGNVETVQVHLQRIAGSVISLVSGGRAAVIASPRWSCRSCNVDELHEPHVQPPAAGSTGILPAIACARGPSRADSRLQDRHRGGSVCVCATALP